MKLTTTALIFGSFVLLLGLLGLVGGTNDVFYDILRIALGAFLIYAGNKSLELSRSALTIFGVLYLGVFAIGLVSPTLFGLIPNGLGIFDQTLHLVGGIAGVALPFLAHSRERIAL